jgi:hypothetical protein
METFDTNASLYDNFRLGMNFPDYLDHMVKLKKEGPKNYSKHKKSLRDEQAKRDKINLEIHASYQYGEAFEDVFLGDYALDLIEEIFDYAGKVKEFNLEFASSVKRFLSERGYITKEQYNSLLNIYNSFKIWEITQSRSANGN